MRIFLLAVAAVGDAAKAMGLSRHQMSSIFSECDIYIFYMLLSGNFLTRNGNRKERNVVMIVFVLEKSKTEKSEMYYANVCFRPFLVLFRALEDQALPHNRRALGGLGELLAPCLAGRVGRDDADALERVRRGALGGLCGDVGRSGRVEVALLEIWKRELGRADTDGEVGHGHFGKDVEYE
jgi:hypothetical protein